MSAEKEPDNAEVLQKLYKLVNKYPSLRVCQIISNAYPEAERLLRGDDMRYVTDKDLFKWLEDYDKKIDELALEAATKRQSER